MPLILCSLVISLMFANVLVPHVHCLRFDSDVLFDSVTPFLPKITSHYNGILL